MITNTIRKGIPEKKSGGSKVMFNGDFKKELQVTIDDLGLFLASNLICHFEVDSIIPGRNNLKIRVNDKGQDIIKLVNCIFRYHHNEEKFGYVNIEIVASEHSSKTKLHFVGKFGVLEREKIFQRVYEDVLICIRMI